MRTITFLLFACLILGSCNNKTSNNSQTTEIKTDTVATSTTQEVILDTLVKISKPFKLNGIKCYWEHKVAGSNKFIIRLLDYNTNKVLLAHDDIFPPLNYKADNYFDEINKESLKDVNFDGHIDVLLKIYSGAMAMNDRIYVYLFDHEDRIYISADELEANRIELIDKKNRKLIAANEYRYGTDSIVHHFDKAGKIKFTDEFSNYTILEDTTWVEYKTYKKIVNGETVYERTKSDTIKWE